MYEIDRYEVRATLTDCGEPPLAVAYDPVLARDVALREIAVAGEGAAASERIRRALSIMANVSHPNCVRVFDLLEDRNPPVVVMEHVPGANLGTLIGEGRRLSGPEACAVLAGALEGLDHLHSLGIAHGGLTPSRVLVDPTGASKLTDAGVGPAGDPLAFGYLAPEDLRGEDPSVPADVYAAGALLYGCLEGSPPFPSGSLEEAMAARDSLPPAPARTPAELVSLVTQALCATPGERPRSAREVLDRLQAAAEEHFEPGWRQAAMSSLAVLGAAGAAATMSALASAAAGAAAGHAALGGLVAGQEAAAGAVAAPGASGGVVQGPPAVGGNAAAGAPARPLPHRRIVRHAGRRGPRSITRRALQKVHAALSTHPVMSGAAVVVVAGGLGLGIALSGGAPPPVASNWSLLSASLGPTSITCHDATHCWADLGNGILVLGPNESRRVVELPAADGTIASISCPSDRDCAAVGAGSGDASVLWSTDGGMRWRPVTVPPNAQNLNSVSCAPGTTSCVAVGSATVLATTNGVTWTAETLPPTTGGLGSVSCASATSCVALAGTAAIGTTDGGHTWSGLDGLPGSEIWNESLDCVTSQICYVIGSHQNSLMSQTGFVYKTLDGGGTWKVLNFPSTLPAYGADSISCWSTTSCIGDGTINNGGVEGSSGTPFFLATSDGGATWSQYAAPESVVSVPTISCSGPSSCWLAGPSGVGRTSDAGKSWKPILPAKGFTIATVACPPSSTGTGDCLFSGTAPYPTSCHIAIGTNCGKTGPWVLSGTTPGGVVATEVGGIWSYGATDPALTAVSSMSCARRADCMLVGAGASGAELAYYSGSHLAALQLPANLRADLQPTSPVSCAPAASCALVGVAGGHPLLLQRSSAGGWSSASVPAQFATVTGIACPSEGTCLAVGTSTTGSAPLAMLHSKGHWATVGGLPAAARTLTAVGCGSATTCWIGTTLANGTEMLRTTDLGSSGSVMWKVEAVPTAVATVTGIACSTVSACLATGTAVGGGSVVLGAGAGASALGWQTLAPTTTTTAP